MIFFVNIKTIIWVCHVSSIFMFRENQSIDQTQVGKVYCHPPRRVGDTTTTRQGVWGILPPTREGGGYYHPPITQL